MRKNTMTLLAAAAAAAVFGLNSSRAAVQHYNTAAGAPGTGADHPGFGFWQADFGAWDDGIDGEFEFAGSDGSFHMEAFCILNNGVTTRTGDHAARFVMDYNPNPPTTSFGTFWFGGVGNDIGPLPTTDYSNVLAYVDVIAPLGKPFEFRVESDYGPSGNGFKFHGVGAGTWQTVGGVATGATFFGSFNPNDPTLAALVAFGNNGQEIVLVDDGSDPNNHPTLIVDNLTLTPAVSAWTDADGNWSDNTKWTVKPADGLNATAVFGATTASRTVTVDGERFAGTVRLNSANAYTIGGTGKLNLRSVGAGTHSTIDVVTGSHTISAPVELWNNTTVTVTPAGSTLNVTGPLTTLANVTLTKTGAGNLSVPNVRMAGLTVSAGTVTVATNGTSAGASNVGALTVSGGTLDLNDNDLLVTGGTYAAVAGAIANARNGGAWDQTGITSSAARTHPQGATTLGVATGSDYISVNGTNFNGFSVAPTDVVVKYTWYGDADLNGEVNFDDYVFTDGGFNNGLTGWLNGDFDLSGGVDFDDYVFIDLGFNSQNGTLRRAQSFLSGEDRSAAGMDEPGLRMVADHYAQFGTDYATAFLSAVPEPAGIGALAAAYGAAMLTRRRRR